MTPRYMASGPWTSRRIDCVSGQSAIAVRRVCGRAGLKSRARRAQIGGGQDERQISPDAWGRHRRVRGGAPSPRGSRRLDGLRTRQPAGARSSARPAAWPPAPVRARRPRSGRGPRRGRGAPTPQAQAPDRTSPAGGFSIVTGWRWRMVTPPGRLRQPADQQRRAACCRYVDPPRTRRTAMRASHGAAAIMRVPGRVHITAG
jgi:hypothetical protein